VVCLLLASSLKKKGKRESETETEKFWVFEKERRGKGEGRERESVLGIRTDRARTIYLGFLEWLQLFGLESTMFWASGF